MVASHASRAFHLPDSQPVKEAHTPENHDVNPAQMVFQPSTDWAGFWMNGAGDLSLSLTVQSYTSASQAMSLPESTRKASRNVACLLYTSDAADERSSVDLG